jgi:hypothetical protein
MVATSTPRLQLAKPDPNDFVNVLTDLDANYDKVDLLGKNPAPITTPFIKRNTADAASSGTNVMFETLTVVLKANHWYDTIESCKYNTTLAINSTPNGTGNIHLKAGGSVAVGDPQIASGAMPNINNTSPRFTIGTTFDVPADGTYTLGFSANSGGANTINIIASGGTDNTGNQRCFWVRDLGEK